MDYATLADLYDCCVRFEEDIQFFIEASREKGRVLELMAGTGRVSIPLIEAGIDLTCVDSSEAMLAVLARKLRARRLEAEILRQDVRTLNVGRRYPLAILPFHSLSELVGRDDRMAALASIFDALEPGGRLLCTLHNPAVRAASFGPDPRVLGEFPRPEGKGSIVFSSRCSLARATGIVDGEQTLRLLDSRGQEVETRRMAVRFILLGRHAFEDEACEAGFEIESILGDYGRAPFDAARSPYMIWSLRRPAGVLYSGHS